HGDPCPVPVLHPRYPQRPPPDVRQLHLSAAGAGGLRAGQAMTLEPFTPEELHERAIRTRKLVTRLILVAIVMFFAGLTSAYVVSMSGGYWVDIKVPQPFILS